MKLQQLIDERKIKIGSVIPFVRESEVIHWLCLKIGHVKDGDTQLKYIGITDDKAFENDYPGSINYAYDLVMDIGYYQSAKGLITLDQFEGLEILNGYDYLYDTNISHLTEIYDMITKCAYYDGNIRNIKYPVRNDVFELGMVYEELKESEDMKRFGTIRAIIQITKTWDDFMMQGLSYNKNDHTLFAITLNPEQYTRRKRDVDFKLLGYLDTNLWYKLYIYNRHRAYSTIYMDDFMDHIIPVPEPTDEEKAAYEQSFNGKSAQVNELAAFLKQMEADKKKIIAPNGMPISKEILTRNN